MIMVDLQQEISILVSDDLVGNPDVRISHDPAHMCSRCFFPEVKKQLTSGKPSESIHSKC